MPNGAQQYEEKPSKKSASREGTKDILSKLRGTDRSEIFYRKILAKDVWSESEGITGTLDNIIQLIDEQGTKSNMGEVRQRLSEMKDGLEKNSVINKDSFKKYETFSNNLLKEIEKLESSSSLTENEEAIIKLLKPLEVKKFWETSTFISKKLEYYNYVKLVARLPEQRVILKEWNKYFSKDNVIKAYKQDKQVDRDKKSSENIMKTISEEEMKIVNNYTCIGYKVYNGITRGEMKGTEKEENEILQLSKLIDRYPMKKGGTYYRGKGDLIKIRKLLISEEDKKGFDKINTTNAKQVAEYMNSLKGHYLVDKGFASTSENKRIAGFNFQGLKLSSTNIGVLLKIKVKPGVPALPILDFSEGKREEEILLNKGTRLKIESARVNSNKTVTINVTAEAPTAPASSGKLPESNLMPSSDKGRPLTPTAPANLGNLQGSTPNFSSIKEKSFVKTFIERFGRVAYNNYVERKKK